ncbi:MAG: stage IV sporulation protein A [Clostridiales bacterium]|nr:stage IV sporulation protein A [Clostridiales bacterium]MCD7827499.1 stage IV sporulation protein A [Clostridiales bacterium]
MDNTRIYDDIRKRTQGDIYIGVVGPVRTGKSTFIKRFMETIVLPNIDGDFVKERAVDELPQSAAGRTIMTTEPKFVPEQAVKVELHDKVNFRVRMVDCVGYIVPSSLGYIEGESPRMVKTPWFPDEIPFNMAAEIGTQKVISEHSTIGLVVTTDGSISDIPRYEYEEAEERVINELKEIDKPFVVLLNCMYPESPAALEMSVRLSEKYGVPAIPVNCLDITEEQIRNILREVLMEFPVKEVEIHVPGWLGSLGEDHRVKKSILSSVKKSGEGLKCIRSVSEMCAELENEEYIASSSVKDISLGDGKASVKADIANSVFYEILSEISGVSVGSEKDLMTTLTQMADTAAKYKRIKSALDEVDATGYGIVMPTIDELTLEEPEIMKQGGKYGVRLKASAPSIHMMKATINTEVAPIVGSESQSEELVMYLLNEFQENPVKIWQSNIFGKSLDDLVNEGLKNKLYHMPTEARMKLQQTLERIINEGCSGLLCIII